MDTSAILAVLTTMLGGANIGQFFFFRKKSREMEAGTKKSEEEAEKAGFNNYRDQLDYFFGVNNKLIETNMKLREENFNLNQKMREYEYKFETYDRKIQGMQRTMEDNIKKFNSLSSEMETIKQRALYAESNICLNMGCKERIPALGTFKHISNENKQ